MTVFLSPAVRPLLRGLFLGSLLLTAFTMMAEEPQQARVIRNFRLGQFPSCEGRLLSEDRQTEIAQRILQRVFDTYPYLRFGVPPDGRRGPLTQPMGDYPTEWESQRSFFLGTNDFELKMALIEAQGYRDFYTGVSLRNLPLEDIHIDHIIPLARGGLNHIRNYVVTTGTFNMGKGDHVEELTADYFWLAQAEVAEAAMAKYLEKKDFAQVRRSELMRQARANRRAEIQPADGAYLYRWRRPTSPSRRGTGDDFGYAVREIYRMYTRSMDRTGLIQDVHSSNLTPQRRWYSFQVQNENTFFLASQNRDWLSVFGSSRLQIEDPEPSEAQEHILSRLSALIKDMEFVFGTYTSDLAGVREDNWLESAVGTRPFFSIPRNQTFYPSPESRRDHYHPNGDTMESAGTAFNRTTIRISPLFIDIMRVADVIARKGTAGFQALHPSLQPIVEDFEEPDPRQARLIFGRIIEAQVLPQAWRQEAHYHMAAPIEVD